MISALIAAGLGTFSAAWRVITRGLGIGSPPITPPERILTILAESRAFAPEDARVFAFSAESRTYTIDETRTYTVPAETRACLV